jgi:hypothetical protein
MANTDERVGDQPGKKDGYEGHCRNVEPVPLERAFKVVPGSFCTVGAFLFGRQISAAMILNTKHVTVESQVHMTCIEPRRYCPNYGKHDADALPAAETKPAHLCPAFPDFAKINTFGQCLPQSALRQV